MVRCGPAVERGVHRLDQLGGLAAALDDLAAQISAKAGNGGG
jgi:hypothetical protein